MGNPNKLQDEMIKNRDERNNLDKSRNVWRGNNEKNKEE